ncbi:dNA primase [Firmicutes bacterium CAG:194]|jgi:DNA primase|nr:DNA primase [Bacillota bacterium]MDY3770462.1 DNA primase [Lachnospiraceae bacterium]CCZ27608.1 dNA primase [Firmicutes bacterium CAG:194]MDD6695804.1 DNA primase [Bacillota bacterium]HCI17844.1 DNA primase [Lachnospiraceae bacterium]
MYYSDELVEEVRQRNDIVDIISGYVNLKKKGGNYFGLCPFHNEKSASFSVSPGKQMYYCFGCGAGGNVFTFIMNYENYTFAEAIKLLADRAGIALPEIEDSKEAREKENRRKTLLQINKEAATYFYYQLRAPQGRVGLDYLKGRQLSDETMNRFGLGYSNKTSNDLCQYLRHKGYPDELIRESGVAVFNEKYGMSDKFWNRVMFPIQDVNHRVIGFGGRVMGEGEPKYLNSPETPVFDKSRNLYGLNFARTARQDNIILCEGYMDVIAMHQAGFTQAVASLGTAFTSGQANLLRRYTENVILSYDSDGAGVKAALRAIGILKEAGLTGKVLNLEPYKDPDEFMKNLGREEFAKRLSQAENTFFFELRMMQKQYDLSDPEAKTKFYNEIAKKLCGFSEEVERENYTEAVAEKYNISMESLKKLVTGYAAKMGMAAEVIRPKQPVQQKNTPKEQQENVQKLLLTWLVEEPHLYKKIKKYITPLSFTNELYRQVAQELFPKLEEGKPNPAAIISRFSQEEEQREAASLFNTKLPYMQQDMESQSQVQEREKAFHDIVVKVKRNAYEHDLKASGSDMEALSRVISGRQELDELEKTHISFD